MRLSTFLTSVTILMNNALFDEEHTVGQAGMITWLRDNAGVVVCWIISAIGFLIVAAAIIKNALAGLYLAFPSLWDKVHDIRVQMNQGLTSAQGGNKVKKVAATMGAVILAMLPDVKDATDFADDGNPNNPNDKGKDSIKFERKHWVMKSIPSFVAMCMIGMLIFYGYPTKLANFAGESMRFALDTIFDTVDPVQMAKKVVDGIATYELATDSATSSLEKNVNALARSAVKQVYTRYSDMHQQPLQETAIEIETRLLNITSTCPKLSDIMSEQDGLTVSFMAQLTATRPVMNESFKPAVNSAKDVVHNLYCAESTSGVKQYKYYIPMDELPHGGSTKVGANDHIVVTVNATPRSQSIVASSRLSYVQKKSGSLNFGSGETIELKGLSLTQGNQGFVFFSEGAHVNIIINNTDGTISTRTGSLEMVEDKVFLRVTEPTKKELQKVSGSSDMATITIEFPSGSFTRYTQVVNEVEVQTKATVVSYVIMIKSGLKEETGWINRAWSDANSADVQLVTGDFPSKFFESKTSTDVQ